MGRIARPGLLLAMVLGTWGLLSSPPEASAQSRAVSERTLTRWLERADRFHQQGREGAALTLLRRTIARAPGDGRAPLMLATLLLPPDIQAMAEPSPSQRQQAAEAELALRSAREAGVDGGLRRRLNLAIARAVAATGDHRGAIELLAAASARLDPELASAMRELSVLALLRHDLSAADDALTSCRNLDPLDKSLLTDQAVVRLARGRATEAVALLEEALERSPADAEMRRDLAGALVASGRLRRGLSILSALAQEQPDDADLALEVARAALELGQPLRAARAAERALARAPSSDPEPAVVLGTAWLAAGRTDEAAAAFRAALSRDPVHPRARQAIENLDRPDRSTGETGN